MSCRQKKAEHQPAEQQQYVKKPLNAYMLFLQEQRPQVNAEIESKGSNMGLTFLGAQVRVLDTIFGLFYFKILALMFAVMIVLYLTFAYSRICTDEFHITEHYVLSFTPVKPSEI